MTDKKRLLIAAAGTGGHVMPALAVARVLKDQGWEIHWLGTKTGMEAGLVAGEVESFTGLEFTGLRGKGLFGAIKGGINLIRAAIKIRRILKEKKIDAVFSTGGYIAVPTGFVSKSCGLPLTLMNCDVDILLSTRMTLKYAEKMACGFAGGARSFAGQKGVVTGNPVRKEITEVTLPEERFQSHKGKLKIFIFGGSLGAQIFNEVIPEALSLIDEASRPIVYHQTGKGRDAAVKEKYKKLGIEAQVMPFIRDMEKFYEEADLVICRAGAISVSEICAAGVASILVPFVVKTTSHQSGNARYLNEKDAAIYCEQSAFTPEFLKETLEKITRNDCLALAKNAKSLAQLDAAKRVADLIKESTSTN